MQESWLVQRLEKPSKGLGAFKDNPFSFGGGLKNGGLSDDAMDLLRGIFSFDYMGAAEFEFGAVPAAIQKIAKNIKHYSTYVITIPLNQVEPSGRDKSKPGGDRLVYVIGSAEDLPEIEKRIRGWAKKPYRSLKCGTMLNRALRPYDEWDSNVCGWLELDNGFFFFTDKEMFEKVAALFEVEVSNGCTLPQNS